MKEGCREPLGLGDGASLTSWRSCRLEAGDRPERSGRSDRQGPWVASERGDQAAAEPARAEGRALLAQLTDPWERSEVLLPLSGGISDERTSTEEVLALKREAGDVIAMTPRSLVVLLRV